MMEIQNTGNLKAVIREKSCQRKIIVQQYTCAINLINHNCAKVWLICVENIIPQFRLYEKGIATVCVLYSFPLFMDKIENMSHVLRTVIVPFYGIKFNLIVISLAQFPTFIFHVLTESYNIDFRPFESFYIHKRDMESISDTIIFISIFSRMVINKKRVLNIIY
jgi:ABC-type enterochelin transport system permease subunit